MTRKPIPGFNRCEADTDGNIWTERKGQLAQRKLTKVHNGYLAVSLRTTDGRWVRPYVHRLIWLAFEGWPKVGQEICHKNGDKTDNRLANLRADTRAGNLADRYKHGTMNHGERCGTAKLTSHEVRGIRDLYATGQHTQASLATKYKVSRSAIEAIVLKKNWKHLA